MRRPRALSSLAALSAAALLTLGSAAAAFVDADPSATRAAHARAARAARPATTRTQAGASDLRARPPVVAIKAARAMPLGSVVTVEGVVTTPPGAFRSSTEDEGFAVEDKSGAGLYVRTNAKTALRVGRRARVAGKLEESNGKLVLVPAGAGAINARGRGAVRLRPQSFPTRGIGEATEGRLVRVEGVVSKAVQADAPYGFRFFVDDGTGEVQIFVSASTKIPAAGIRAGRRVSVTGFSGQYKEHYEVEPRFAADIRLGR